MEKPKQGTPEWFALRERARTDQFFLADCLGYDFQPDVHAELFSTFIQKDRKKAYFDCSETKSRLILWPRGHYKTSATVVEIVQTILNFPDVRILLMSANIKLTMGWLWEIKSHFNGKNSKSELPYLFPEFCATKLGNRMAFTTPARVRKHLKNATVTVASPKATETGSHYDIFFADDLVNTSNFRNIELLDKLESEFSHFIPLLDPGGYTVVTGTRYHFADVYGRFIKKNTGAWLISVKEARTPDRKLLFPARKIADGRTIGFTNEMLDEIERNDPEMFNAQYMNRIISFDKQLFPEALLLQSIIPTRDAQGGVFMALDLAGSSEKRSDESALAIGKWNAPTLALLDCIAHTYTPHQLATVVLQQVVKWNPICLFIEKSQAAEAFEALLQVLAREKGIVLKTVLEKVPNNNDAKYQRISALETAMRTKRLRLCAGMTDFEGTKEQFMQYPKGRRNDRADSISLLYYYLTLRGAMQYAAPPRVKGFFDDRPQEKQFSGKPNGMGFGFRC